MDTASSQWLKLGEKKKDSYSYWIYRKGEKLMDKIEFEEWALKNVKEGQGVKILGPNDKGTQEKIKVSFFCSLLALSFHGPRIRDRVLSLGILRHTPHSS